MTAKHKRQKEKCQQEIPQICIWRYGLPWHSILHNAQEYNALKPRA